MNEDYGFGMAVILFFLLLAIIVQSVAAMLEMWRDMRQRDK